MNVEEMTHFCMDVEEIKNSLYERRRKKFVISMNVEEIMHYLYEGRSNNAFIV